MRAPPRPAPPVSAAAPRPATVGRDRREGERLIAYWDGKLQEFGDGITIASLDITAIGSSRDWSNRFLISVDPVIERSALIMYGVKFAGLLGLPEQPRTDQPLLRQLPRRYGEVFLRGCEQAQKEWAPVRLEGEVARDNGQIEQYRVVFIPVGVRPNALTCFAFGAFSRRLIDQSATEG
ncbi:MAG TPA: hypothetical protein VME41_05655 [Stellaceae bacterium]|nr:hypothetical protein [Stellaceae bacterium]